MAVLSFDEALFEVERRSISDIRLRPTDDLDLLSARGRVLAEPVRTRRDQPPFARATRDGFAVQAHGLCAASGAGLHLRGEVRAGERWSGSPLQHTEALAIMTGAPLPAGADAVVMIEHVQLASDRVLLSPGRTLRSGENVVPRGAEAAAGAVVLPAGMLLGASALAMAASCGSSRLRVVKRPSVSVIATGDELVELDEHPEDWQIHNSNSYSLAALVHAAGGTPKHLAVARDTREQIWDRIAEGRTSDLLLLSGGVSMGKYDLVEEVLAELKAEFFFTGVRMQPGKPIVFGQLPERVHANGSRQPACLFFGLPGNPVSTEVTFHCFVAPLLRVLSGASWTGPRFAQATLAESVSPKPGLTRFLPAHLQPSRVQPSVHLVPWQGSGDLAANARSNCYVVLSERADIFPTGEVVTILERE